MCCCPYRDLWLALGCLQSEFKGHNSVGKNALSGVGCAPVAGIMKHAFSILCNCKCHTFPPFFIRLPLFLVNTTTFSRLYNSYYRYCRKILLVNRYFSFPLYNLPRCGLVIEWSVTITGPMQLKISRIAPCRVGNSSERYR